MAYFRSVTGSIVRKISALTSSIPSTNLSIKLPLGYSGPRAMGKHSPSQSPHRHPATSGKLLGVEYFHLGNCYVTTLFLLAFCPPLEELPLKVSCTRFHQGIREVPCNLCKKSPSLRGKISTLKQQQRTWPQQRLALLLMYQEPQCSNE